MASTWNFLRPTASGATRYRVEYRLGGRESRTRYGGSFRTKREALARQRWLESELAAMRTPDLGALRVEAPKPPTLAEAAARWRESRVDVAEGTRVLHRVALDRVLPTLGSLHVDELTPDHVVELVTMLTATGRKRETIKKSVRYLGNVLDYAGVDPNPAQDARVRMPYEAKREIEPPAASHVSAVFERLPSKYRLPLLFLDWSGARVAAIETATVGDYDRINRKLRLRAETQKTRKALWVELPSVLADAIEANLDDDLEAPIFAGVAVDAFRTAITRACKEAGIPPFSPHDLRHRRISLLHAKGESWALIGQRVGQRNLSVTANTYTHVLLEPEEIDLEELLTG